MCRVHSYGARFAGVVFPGETLRASIWKDDGKLLATITAPSRDDAVDALGREARHRRLTGKRCSTNFAFAGRHSTIHARSNPPASRERVQPLRTGVGRGDN